MKRMTPTGEPLVSVIVANYNGERFLTPLLKSLTRQSLKSLEIIVIDDASTDNSRRLILAAAAADPRIRFVALTANVGPAAARNFGLANACGKWIAIVDGDDLIHPCRFERLIAAAEDKNADIIADDLLVFYDDGSKPHRFLEGRRSRSASKVSLTDYVKENKIFGHSPALGYLKPIFRRDAFARSGLIYNETLRIGEDYDLIARALAAGLTFWIEPFPYYLYRKHTSSISHMLTDAPIHAMLSAENRVVAQNEGSPRREMVQSAFQPRTRSLHRAIAWNGVVRALKSRDFLSAFKIAKAHPSVLPLLAMPVQARLSRLKRKLRPPLKTAATETSKSICLISRQRLGSATSGSAAYVLSIAAALRGAGHDVHLLQPSPSVFGRLPVMIFGRDARVFKTVRVRGGLRLGNFVIAKNPRIFMVLAKGIAVRLLAKANIRLVDKPAPYSVGAPWTPDDYLFVARHAPKVSNIILFDYAFQTDAFAYALRPDAKSFVLMHDLISSRYDQFEALGETDSLTALSIDQEMRMLTGADVVIAIQAEEAATVANYAPAQRIICAPMAVVPEPESQPGNGTDVFFVGTKTAPNVIGLNWFLKEVWPIVTQEMPRARLNVAGSVSRMVRDVPETVRLLGVVPDLGPYYKEAGVVISPLLAGSGLKIKLVAALAQGKAIVATTPTTQGIYPDVRRAIIVADDPRDFANAVVHLLRDEASRNEQSALALHAARKHFSPEACYGELLAAFGDGSQNR